MENISQYIENFRFALISLVDAFQKGSILYLDNEQGDDFDHVAEALFVSFVIIPLVDADILSENNMKFIYGTERLCDNLFIFSKNNNSGGIFRQFSTSVSPFDNVVVCQESDSYSMNCFSAINAEYFLAIND
jgi:hypothetical protein